MNLRGKICSSRQSLIFNVGSNKVERNKNNSRCLFLQKVKPRGKIFWEALFAGFGCNGHSNVRAMMFN